MLQLLVTTYDEVYSPNLKIIRVNRKLEKWCQKMHEIRSKQNEVVQIGTCLVENSTMLKLYDIVRENLKHFVTYPMCTVCDIFSFLEDDCNMTSER